MFVLNFILEFTFIEALYLHKKDKQNFDLNYIFYIGLSLISCRLFVVVVRFVIGLKPILNSTR